MAIISENLFHFYDFLQYPTDFHVVIETWSQLPSFRINSMSNESFKYYL